MVLRHGGPCWRDRPPRFRAVGDDSAAFDRPLQHDATSHGGKRLAVMGHPADGLPDAYGT
jgi:hypothetical protein